MLIGRPVELADEARGRAAVGEAELEERRGARGDPDPVGRADQITGPLVAIRAEGGSDLRLVTVGLEDERLADVLGGHPPMSDGALEEHPEPVRLRRDGHEVPPGLATSVEEVLQALVGTHTSSPARSAPDMHVVVPLLQGQPPSPT